MKKWPATEDRRGAMVIAPTVYYPGAGHSGHNNLSVLADDTGGEAYWQGFATSINMKPYLDDLSGRLK